MLAEYMHHTALSILPAFFKWQNIVEYAKLRKRRERNRGHGKERKRKQDRKHKQQSRARETDEQHSEYEGKATVAQPGQKYNDFKTTTTDHFQRNARGAICTVCTVNIDKNKYSIGCLLGLIILYMY